MVYFREFFSEWLKFFFLLTPFFVLSMFLSMTGGLPLAEKRRTAVRVIIATFTACMILFFFGNWVFEALGITLDAFRLGGGALLFLSAVGLVNGTVLDSKMEESAASDIAVVPLAIPVTVGPGTTAALLVMGADAGGTGERITGCLALIFAIACLGGILLCATHLERIFGRRGLTILSKLTGLILAALAAQIVISGVMGVMPK